MTDFQPPMDDAPALEVAGLIATITLRRPQSGNRLTGGDLKVLTDLIDRVNGSGARVLVLRSLGKQFCTGFDIGAIGVPRSGPSFGEVATALEQCRPVSIAALQGGVFGGATDLALACDFRFGTARTTLAMPAAKLGLHFYLSGMQRYVSRLGLNAAKMLFLQASTIKAEEMLAIGYLTRLVPEQDLDQSVGDCAEACAALAPLAVMSMKKHLNALAAGQVSEREFADDLALCESSADLREGIAAWSQRRAPSFVGS